MSKYVDKEYCKKINFFKLPKELFKNEKYKKMTIGARVLYSFLLDRLNLSFENNWSDKNGDYYIITTREEIIEFLSISKQTCSNLFKELRAIKLIEEKKQGLGKPHLIYVIPLEVEKLDDYKIDDYKMDLSRSKNATYRSKDIRQQEVEKLDGIKTDNIKTNINNTNLNNKENNSIINNTIIKENVAVAINFSEKVFLKQEQYDKLIIDYGKEMIDNAIIEITEYMFENPKKKYTDFNLMIRKWLSKNNSPKCKNLELMDKMKEIWNNKTKGILNTVTKLDQTRKRKIEILINEFNLTEEIFDKIINMIINTDFYIGKNDKGWKADFDWVIKEDKFIKLFEESETNKEIKYTNLGFHKEKMNHIGYDAKKMIEDMTDEELAELEEI